MVEALAAGPPGGSPNVLAAMSRVPRETFASRFWGFAPTFWKSTIAFRSRIPEDAGVVRRRRGWSRRSGPPLRRRPGLGHSGSTGGRLRSECHEHHFRPRIVAAMLQLLDVSAGNEVRSKSAREVGTTRPYSAHLWNPKEA